LTQENREGATLPPDALCYLIGLDHAGIAYTGAQVGTRPNGAAARGRLDRTIVTVTAEHGEEFLDHGELPHVQVYDELLQVPLLVSLPEQRGAAGRSCRGLAGEPGPRARLEVPVQHVDLPTVAECLGVERPAGVQGRSFLTALDGAPALGCVREGSGW
jgi:arylsulfatase A-like enzyme